MRARLIFFLLAAALLFAPRAAASSALVPDEYATITAAIASGADTVLVRDGAYAETVTVARPLVLARFDPGGPPASRPFVTCITVAAGPSGWTRVTGFRVEQNLALVTSMVSTDLWFERCAFEAGISRAPSLGPRLRVTECDITGSVDVNPWSLEFTGNRLTGDLTASYEDFATIAFNWITGAPGFGIMLENHEDYARISDNVVSDCGAGIRVRRPGHTPVERNLIERCAGDGILVYEPDGQTGNTIYVVDNVIRDVGGDGIVFGHLGGTAIGNTLERIGKTGIRAGVPNSILFLVRDNRVTGTGGAGLGLGDSWVTQFSHNTILRAGGHGADLGEVSRADSNVIGRCRGDGLRVTNLLWETLSATHNTLYLNEGSGLAVGSALAGFVTANIGYGNGRYALDWSGPGVATLACNLGYGNHAGNVLGAEPSETDRDGDPLFCDLPADDVHIGPGSAAILAGCETAGALGPGCVQSVGVGGAPRAAALRAWPQPARTNVRFEWPAGSHVRLEVFDTRGARCWRYEAPASASGAVWDLRDTGGARLAPGVYFVRASADGRTAVARFVVAP
jgi:hypothetical protein